MRTPCERGGSVCGEWSSISPGELAGGGGGVGVEGSSAPLPLGERLTL